MQLANNKLSYLIRIVHRNTSSDPKEVQYWGIHDPGTTIGIGGSSVRTTTGGCDNISWYNILEAYMTLYIGLEASPS